MKNTSSALKTTSTIGFASHSPAVFATYPATSGTDCRIPIKLLLRSFPRFSKHSPLSTILVSPLSRQGRRHEAFVSPHFGRRHPRIGCRLLQQRRLRPSHARHGPALSVGLPRWNRQWPRLRLRILNSLLVILGPRNSDETPQPARYDRCGLFCCHNRTAHPDSLPEFLTFPFLDRDAI